MLSENFKRILVSAGPAIGDILLATPLIHTWRDAYPDAAIDVLIFNGQEGILDGNPDVSEIITVAKRPDFRGYIALIRRIFRRYDLAISTKWTDRVIFYIILAARYRVSVIPANRDAWKRWFMHGSVNYDPDDTHTLVLDNQLAGCLGLRPSYTVVPPSRPGAGELLDQRMPVHVRGETFAVLHLSPGLPFKRWTLDGWAAVAEYLDSQGLQLVLTGHTNPDEQQYLRAALERMPSRTVDLSGKLWLPEVAELLKACSVFIGVDTVVTHLAAAVGAQTVALFGPTNARVWGPWPKNYADDNSPFTAVGTQRSGNVVVVQPSDPRPCCPKHHLDHQRCRNENCLLMSKLSAERVIDAIRMMWSADSKKSDFCIGGPAGTLNEPLNNEMTVVTKQRRDAISATN